MVDVWAKKYREQGDAGFATYSGRMAGPAAARYASGATALSVERDQLAGIDARFQAPRGREGSMGYRDFLAEVHKVVQPLGNSLYRSEARMSKALEQARALRELLPKVKAEDPHHLFVCNEFESMILCAELFFTASLARKESIGWFLREDCPDFSGSYKWYTLEQKDGKVAVTSEDVPLSQYRYQPKA